MTIDDLVFIIGKKQIEIEFLSKQVELLKKENVDLKGKIEDFEPQKDCD